ncbi:hypothetical protein [Pseudonocardia abyssalis]|uniref:Uncharacterized protein n=1 Tax=Pseudonocardia abyssalis TaxID=2792008 RepID=A0ABS6USA1_9PSEU|nr:hypothetical protein [Pseudonocardia abyssalis]MBW0113867.1 hypothetical protein [Pseudonocardia abyssalis]MBW0135136.1 hypothetical protein [Pseudonocardia abyssalis]
MTATLPGRTVADRPWAAAGTLEVVGLLSGAAWAPTLPPDGDRPAARGLAGVCCAAVAVVLLAHVAAYELVRLPVVPGRPSPSTA